MTEHKQAAQETPQRTRIVTGIDALILALKASGGYKYRAMIQVADGVELDTLIATSEARLRFMAHCLQVAEAMLRELPPSAHADRWDEYQGRCREALETNPK